MPRYWPPSAILVSRELFDFPVVGVSEAAMLTACMLGGRFAIVTFSSTLVGWYRDCVEANAMSARCAGILALDLPFEVAEDRARSSEAMLELALGAVRDNGADSLIFAGAPLAGLARQERDRIPVPVVDPVGAAVKQAEALIGLAPKKATAGTFRRPPAKSASGMDPLLQRRIAHLDGGDP